MTARVRPVVVMAVLALGLPSARAQVADHLDCYKVKDAIGKAAYTADLAGLAPASCRIKLPGILFCVPTTKTNVDPMPPGADPAPPAGRFLCYKVKCPKSALTSVAFTDQFGPHLLQPRGRKLLCAPEAPAPASTTTTATTSTTVTSNTGCSFEGASCSVHADCCVTPCIMGICQTCRMGGQSCNVNVDCCEGLCTGGICAGPPP